VPRVARLIALAIRFEQLLGRGLVKNQAELARLGHVSRARLTQVMNLLNLAPDTQEAVLFLPRVEHGRDPVTEQDLRPIVATANWRKQRRAWLLLPLDGIAASDAKPRMLSMRWPPFSQHR